MKPEKLRIGLAGAVHPNMPGDDEGLYRSVASAMAALAAAEGFELRVLEKPIRTESDGASARDFFDAAGVDFTLLFNASLPFGRIILPLARVRSPLGLWSVPEPSTSGVLQLNSFCGTNMLGSIIANYLREHDIRYKWFYGAPDSPRFLERFRLTLRALRAIKTLRSARIGQIGGLANGFENMYIDERLLEKKFGTYLQTRHSVEEIVARAERIPDAAVKADLAVLGAAGKLDSSRLAAAQVEKSSRVYLALKEFAREHGYDSLAVSCWSRFQEAYGIAVCGAMSRLNEDGIATPCEADIPSAVTMLLLNALNGSRASLNDLVALDEGDGSFNLWHCGVAPSCWADKRGVVWDNHFNIGKYADGGCTWCGDGLVADMAFKPGPVTVSCLNNDFDDLLILSGEIIEGKAGYAGSSGWVGKPAVNGVPVGHDDLIETIVTGRVNHHFAAAFGDLTDELNEFAAWTGTRVLEAIPYRPYLQRRPRSDA
jgi:L-fucose isomerase-like protein